MDQGGGVMEPKADYDGRLGALPSSVAIWNSYKPFACRCSRHASSSFQAYQTLYCPFTRNDPAIKNTIENMQDIGTLICKI